MKLKLSDWLAIRWGTEQCMDVIAQLLEIPHEEMGSCLDPSAFYLTFPEDDPSFGDLERTRECREYDPDFKPVEPLGTEADDVFVIGLMLYRLLTGRPPELGMARFLKVRVHGDQTVPLLHVPNSTLGPLVERMTDLNPATRINRLDALEELAKLWTGTARISVVEAETGAELDRIEVPLGGAETLWKIPHRLHYGDMLLVPYRNKDMRLPFRVCTKAYPFPTAAQQEAPPPCTAQMLRMPGYAMDVGTSGVRLICLGGSSDREIILSEPPVAAFRSREELVTGSEARELHAGRLVITSHHTDADREETLLAEDGASVRLTPRAGAEALMESMFRRALEIGMYAQEPVTVAFPAGWDTVVRAFWLRAARKAGFRTASVTSSAAILLCHSLYEPVRDNVMVVDAGAGSVDVCIVPCKSGGTPEKLAEYAGSVRQSFRAGGGEDMTDLLVRDLLRTFDLQHGLNLYRSSDSGLNAAQFAENREVLRNAAEHIKCSLSFTAQAEEAVSLHDGTAAPLEVTFRYTRTQLVSLLESVTRAVRQAMQQACAGRGLTREQIVSVVVAGGASLSPVVRQAVTTFFANTTCRVVYRDKARCALRGAAFFTALCGSSAIPSAASGELPYDLGIITADSVQQLPEFQALLPTGTSIGHGANCTFEVTVTDMDLDPDGRCLLRIYCRQSGMEHVRNTLDPEGSCIRIVGKLIIPLPKQFRLGEDRLEVHMTVQADESISAAAKHIRRVKPRLFGKKSRSEDGGLIAAEYLPKL